MMSSVIYRATMGLSKTSCEPHQKVVYLKTHKTGSTTLCSIIDRYAFTRNLTVLVPKKGHFINYRNIFSAKQIDAPEANHSKKRKWSLEKGYDVLTNHARLNRKEMDKVFHDARYVTILREPAAQWQSAFNYFEIWKAMPLSKEPMKLFLSQPKKYFARVLNKKQYYKESMHNQHLFDFGMNQKDMDDDEKVKSKIGELDTEFDLVMITEYFDESLLLLRKLLCWRMDDIVYLMQGVRSAKYRKKDDDSLVDKIREWNKADVMLYKHFNETFWRKVREYGPSFSQDLANFKTMLADASDLCLNKIRVKKVDRRAESFFLNKNAPPLCHRLAMGDVAYTRVFHQRMQDRNVPFYKNANENLY